MAGLTEWHYAAVFAFGTLVGVAELVARYRDAPLSAVTTGAAVVYILINAIAAGFALWLIEVNGWTFGGTAPAAVAAAQVLVAGFGAIAFFRSSLFTLRVGDSDVQIGPSAFLNIILNAADRSVDRARAEARAKAVSEIMAEVSFAKAKDALTTYCLALMQNVPADEADRLGEAVKSLANAAMSEDVKTLNLGLLLMTLVGEEVLRTAVENLGDKILIEAP